MTTVVKMLELSTAHVSTATAKALDNNECQGVISFIKDE